MTVKVYITLMRLFYIFIISSTLSCTTAKDRQLTNELPNIIFILADDMSYRDLSCYGQTKFQTPNIDRIAFEGILFTNAYAGSPECAPTRCSKD